MHQKPSRESRKLQTTASQWQKSEQLQKQKKKRQRKENNKHEISMNGSWKNFGNAINKLANLK